MFRNFQSRIVLAFSCAILMLSSCGVESPKNLSKDTKEFDYTIALEWSNQFLEVDRYTTNAAPPATARQMGYLNLACYEAVLPGMESEYRSIASKFQGLTIPAIDKNQQYDYSEVYNACYSRSLTQYFKDMPSKISFDVISLESKWEKDIEKTVAVDVVARSRDYGRRVADAVFAWSKTDAVGADLMSNLKPQYNAPVGPGFWLAGTSQASGNGVLPQLGQARAFTFGPNENIVRDPAEIYGITYSEDPNSLMYLQAKEVMAATNKARNGAPYNELYWRAEFWSDDIKGITFSPPGRIVAIAIQMFPDVKPNLAVAVECLAKIGVASTDCAIATWKGKYIFNIERPDTYINRVIDKNWKTILGVKSTLLGKAVTPPFPAYPSGHSTFGGSGGLILSEMFGYNHPMTDKCHEGRTEFYGKARYYKNFTDQGEENAYSRIPLGVHYRMDCEEGLYTGREVARRVLNLGWKR